MTFTQYMRQLTFGAAENVSIDRLLRTARDRIKAGEVTETAMITRLRELGACEPEIAEALA